MSHQYRLGCDIGGTFTDFVLLDHQRSTFETRKVLSTPVDPSRAVETGVADLDIPFPDFFSKTEHLIHGTTLVIDTIIERKGAKTALITTEGFRNILEIRREIRYDSYGVILSNNDKEIDTEATEALREKKCLNQCCRVVTQTW